jgi:hypothetical protein
MGPQRILTDRRGYLTETVFDAERGVFCERALPPPFTALPAPSPAERIGVEPATLCADRLRPRGMPVAATAEPDTLAAAI